MAERSELVKAHSRSGAQQHKARETLRLTVIFLDDSEHVFEVEVKHYATYYYLVF
ncbi:FERM domain-containing protein 7 isoform X1, partial [Tachysurus ichikawai]